MTFFMRTALITAGLSTRLVLATPRNVPPKISGDVQVLGHTYDSGFGQPNTSNPNDPGFYSDGGAGGLVNGYHMLTLSDARDSPTNITILGDYKADPHWFFEGNGAGQGVVRSNPSDACQNENFGPAPNTMMVPLEEGSTTGLNVWSIYCGTVQYNTLIEWDATDLAGRVANNENIPNTRTVDRLFNVRDPAVSIIFDTFADQHQASQPLYGTDGFAIDDKYIYLVARNDADFKIARVEKDKRTDISQYKYYYPTAAQWNETIPAPEDSSPDVNFFIGTDPGNGVQFGSDLFFSPYFNTWLLSYSSAAYVGLYNLAYSSTGNVEGPYEDLSGFYAPQLDDACMQESPGHLPQQGYAPPVVYLMHSHPGYDASGKTLVVGWISCNAVTNFARITFQ
ncbi:hypothetical protein M409DRAFT_54778 [Zasmidium cellare ATCC 36951]|uniref:DUF4185 domain-containing protein n=1 Tax=Zasmidium cellare ATCC 36951 TaxID=1080233 RepID=A0A6A6CGQ5_ZASCE|nr:uncharacterized protein M409DRAFT_54778 [Zasmidium cellare ATCC 36951]KAF2166427.1 hypothetical protein M409DRAFT_54778 [Zasmidium cellare ATCC 36951]